MNNTTALSVEGVSKKYCKSLKKSMLYGISDIARNMVGVGSSSDVLRKDEFWSVDDVSFELKKGESLGLIGPNGSGKTTLLKMLNGIFWPDKGRIAIQGRVGALIEVGAGFHPLLTGRENIYVNAAILGMTKMEVTKKFDSIVEFADIGDFLDTPVKNYSSGMFVRLGFAVAVHCDPDILLIDEVLAVGDVSFRSKCYNKIAELKKQCAVIIVSHDMSAITRICSQCILLNKGRVVFCGPPDIAMQKYLESIKQDKGTVTSKGVQLIGSAFSLSKNNGHYVLISGCSFTVNLSLDSEVDCSNATLLLHFESASGDFAAEYSSSFNGSNIRITRGRQDVTIRLSSVRLNPGVYMISLIIMPEDKLTHLLWVYKGWFVSVVAKITAKGSYQLKGEYQVVNGG